MQVLKKSLCLMLALSVAVSVSADEQKGKKGKANKAPTPTQRFVAKLTLTDAQKEQVAAIDKEFGPAAAEINKARQALLTDEQKQAEKDARKAAKDAGTKGAAAKKALDAALKLTDEQKTKMKEIDKKTAEMNGKIVEALKKFLTAEQQAELPKIGGEGRKKGKKKDAA